MFIGTFLTLYNLLITAIKIFTEIRLPILQIVTFFWPTHTQNSKLREVYIILTPNTVICKDIYSIEEVKVAAIGPLERGFSGLLGPSPVLLGGKNLCKTPFCRGTPLEVNG